MKYVSASEMRAIDEKAIHEYGIPSLLLMENAGRACAEEAAKLAGEKGARVAVFAGKGNNGGDGLVAARHLANRGFEPEVFFFQARREMKPDPAANFDILAKMKVPLVDCSGTPDWNTVRAALGNARVVIDALFGTGLSKTVDEPFKTAIDLINQSKLPVVAVDVPSGLNADTGEVLGVCVRAAVTVTLALPKKGFLNEAAQPYLGRVIVADISIPADLLV